MAAKTVSATVPTIPAALFASMAKWAEEACSPRLIAYWNLGDTVLKIRAWWKAQKLHGTCGQLLNLLSQRGCRCCTSTLRMSVYFREIFSLKEAKRFDAARIRWRWIFHVLVALRENPGNKAAVTSALLEGARGSVTHFEQYIRKVSGAAEPALRIPVTESGLVFKAIQCADKCSLVLSALNVSLDRDSSPRKRDSEAAALLTDLADLESLVKKTRRRLDSLHVRKAS